MKKQIILGLLIPLVALADSDATVSAGNLALQNGKPEEALTHYQKAQDTFPGNPDLSFNQGGAEYKLKKYDEASTYFLSATNNSDPIKRAEAFRHYGDTLFRQEKIGGAIQAYTQALTLNPQDKIAAHNLEVALNKQSKEEPSSQQNQENQEQNQENQDKQNQEQQNQQNQEQQNQNQENQDKQNQENQNQQDPNKEQQDKQNQEQQNQENQNQEDQQNKEQSAQKEQQNKEGQKSQEQQQAEQNAKNQQNQDNKKDGQQANNGEPKKTDEQPAAVQDKLLDAIRAKEKSFLHAKKKGKNSPPADNQKDW